MSARAPVLPLLCALAAPGAASSAELNAQEIADRVLERNVFGLDNATAELRLVIRTPSGGERVREMVVYSRKQAGAAQTLVRFLGPADVAGTAFLVHEKPDGPDDQFLYLPALGKTKRISGSQRKQRFMGTELTYADMESRSLQDAEVKRLPDASLGGEPAYVIEGQPKDTDSEYSRSVLWVHPQAFVPLRVELYDARAQLLKVISANTLERRSGRWVVTSSTIENVQTGAKTLLALKNIDFAAKLDDRQFSQTALEGR